jgi:hypothetical protein
MDHTEMLVDDKDLRDSDELSAELKRMATLLRYAMNEFNDGEYQVAIDMIEEGIMGYTGHTDEPLVILQTAIRYRIDTEGENL